MSAGVIKNPCWNNYPRGRACKKTSIQKKIYRKSLTVPKKSHSAHSLFLYIAKPYFLVGFFTLEYASQRMLELYYKFLKKILWRWQVWRTWNGHRLPPLGSVGRGILRLYSPWKARWVECEEFGRLYRHFRCQRNRQFLSQNVLQQTQKTG